MGPRTANFSSVTKSAMENFHRLTRLLVVLLCIAWAAPAATAEPRETCQSLECVILSAGIASMMNQSAKPCEDFYDYACGNFPMLVSYSPRKVSPFDTVGQNLFEHSYSKMVENVENRVYEILVLDRLAVDSDPDIGDLYHLTRQFFRNCTKWLQRSESYGVHSQQLLSESFMNGMLNHLMQGIEPGSGAEPKQLESVLAAMLRSGGNSLISVSLNRALAYMARPSSNSSAVPRAVIEYRNDNWSSELYLGIGSLLRNSKGLNCSDAVVTTLLGSIRYMRSSCMNYTKQFRCSLAELDEISKCENPDFPFSWTLFFEELLHSPVDSGMLVEISQPRGIIAAMGYFKNQSVYSVDGGSFSEHTSFLILDWLLSFGEFLPADLRKTWRDRKEDRYISLVNTPQRSGAGHIQDCMLWTKSYMQPVLERMYRSVHHPSGFDDVKDLISLIKNASIESVRRQNWIKSSGQEEIVNKIEWIQLSIGLNELSTVQMKEFYNKTLNAYRAIEKPLDGPAIINFGSLMSTVLCANIRKNFDIISGRSPVTVFNYANPLEVNAYSFQRINRIVFPMAILEPPVYHPSYPGYIKLGRLGRTIGHEIGHAFDDDGHELNRLGAVGHFWDNETEAAYLERMECVRSCYGNYTLFPGGPLYNSNTTLGNDISDIIGIKAAFGALQMLKRTQGDSMPNLPNLQLNLNQDQLFFVHLAQGWCMKAEKDTLLYTFGRRYPSHSANHLRVTGMMQNSWEFARTFKCRPGQGMHPVREKCSFW